MLHNKMYCYVHCTYIHTIGLNFKRFWIILVHCCYLSQVSNTKIPILKVCESRSLSVVPVQVYCSLRIENLPTQALIYKISYDNRLTIMPKLRSTYDTRLIYKTTYEGRSAFLRYDSLAKM